MKLHEIDVKTFNDLVKAEPDSSIYQTSYYADHMVSKGYRAVFLEVVDDKDICQGLSALLLKKESFLSRSFTAYAPYGFLFNYYDEPSFRVFHEMLMGYLKQQKVGKLIIEPQVDEGNAMVLRMLNDLGYRKESDLSIYEEYVARHENEVSDQNVILKIRSEEDGKIFEKLNENKNNDEVKIFNDLKAHALAYIAQLDSVKSKRAIEESLSQLEDFISKHKDDYKFVEEVADKENEAAKLKKVYNSIVRYEKAGNEDPDVAAYCVSLFSDKCTIMFRMNSDKEDFFHCEKEIIDQICADCLNRGIIKVDSGEKFCYSYERKLLGRFALKI